MNEENKKPIQEPEIEVDVEQPVVEEQPVDDNTKTIVYAVKLRESEIKGVKAKAETEFNLRVSDKLAQSDVYFVVFIKGFENDMHRFENEFLKDIYEYEEVSEEEIESGFEVVGEGELEDEDIENKEGIYETVNPEEYEDYDMGPKVSKIGKGGKEEKHCPACAADSKKKVKDQDLIIEEKKETIPDHVKKIVDDAIVEVKNKGDAPTIENIMEALKKRECEEIAKHEKEIKKYLSDMDFPKEKEIKTPEGFSDKIEDCAYSIHKKVGDSWKKVFDCDDLTDALDSLDTLKTNIPNKEYKIVKTEKKTSK